MEPILRVENLSKRFGDLVAVKNLSFEVFPGEIFGIAGPNGAGKTVLFNCITKVPYSPDSGRLIFEGKEITKYTPHEICHMGISRTFQIPAIFPSLTAFENVLVGSVFGERARFPLAKIFKKPANESIFLLRTTKALEFVGMLDKKDSTAKDLSLLDIKLLMVASALATKPKLIMLDEPVGGLNKPEIKEFMGLIRKINSEGITIVIIEHIMAALMNLSKSIMVLDHGEKISEGTPQQVSNDKAVIEAYLGQEIQL